MIQLCSISVNEWYDKYSSPGSDLQWNLSHRATLEPNHLGTKRRYSAGPKFEPHTLLYVTFLKSSGICLSERFMVQNKVVQWLTFQFIIGLYFSGSDERICVAPQSSHSAQVNTVGDSDLHHALRNFNKGILLSSDHFYNILAERLCAVRVGY